MCVYMTSPPAGPGIRELATPSTASSHVNLSKPLTSSMLVSSSGKGGY